MAAIEAELSELMGGRRVDLRTASEGAIGRSGGAAVSPRQSGNFGRPAARESQD